MSVHPISFQQILTVYCSGLTIGIGSLRENSFHRKIREILLGIAGGGRCLGLSNRCTFWLANKQAGKYISATELDLNNFGPLSLGELMWYLRIKVNYSDLASYTTVFDPRRDKNRWFIPFLFYALVYPNIASNLVNLSTLSPWYHYVCTHTCYPFSRKLLLRWHRTVETGLLINWQLALNSCGY